MEHITTLGRRASGSNTAARATRNWLQHGLALFALLITSLLVVPVQAQMERLYLRNSQNNPGAGGIVRDMMPTQGGAGTHTSSSTTSTSYAERMAFTIDYADLPNAIGGTSFDVSVNVSGRTSNAQARFRLQRTNSSGTVQASSAYSSAFTSTGVRTATFVLPQDWGPGDRLRLSVEVRRNGGWWWNSQNITVSTGNANSWVEYLVPPPCTGTPAPGNTLASVVNTCVDVPFTLSLQNATPGTGVTHQWQSSADGNAWINIGGADQPTLNISQSAATWYRCLVTCDGNTGASVPVEVLMDAVQNCYCDASATDPAYERITRVAVGTIDHSSSANTGYEDHTAVVGQLLAGADNALTVEYGWVNAPNGYTEDQVLIWIDMDGNGVFDANELLYTSAPGLSPRTGTLTVPAGTPGITTRMRVRLHDTHTGGYPNTPNATPCGESLYGQVEDYTVTILPDVCNALPAATAATTPVDCETSTFMIAVDITDLNGAASLDIVATPGGTLLASAGLGLHLLGPFATGTSMELLLQHPDGPLCDVDLGPVGSDDHCLLNAECHPSGIAVPDNGCGSDALAVDIAIDGINNDLGNNAWLRYIDVVLEHPNSSEIRISLTSPSGLSREIFTIPGSSGATDLGDPAACGTSVLRLRDGGQDLNDATFVNGQLTGTYAPVNALADFTGDPNGNWTITVCDEATGNTGALHMAYLRFVNVDCMGVHGGSAWPGTPCTPADVCTTDAVWDNDCNCTGTMLPDSDGDGVCDLLDGCPNDPAKTEPGACGCGVADTDTDGDGVPDCLDMCPLDPNKTEPGNCGCGSAEPGTACDDGNPGTVNDVIGTDCMCSGQPLDCTGVVNGSALPGTPCDDGDPETVNDAWDNDCNCAGTWTACPQNDVVLVLDTDDHGAQTSWELLNADDAQAVCNGSGYGNNSSITEACCLPDGCYLLRVYDSFGDGMGDGGYVLRMNDGRRIIDNSDNGDFGLVSQLALDQGFCLPLGDVEVSPSRADILEHEPGSWIRATAHTGVSAQYGTNNANSGYQFWMFDPNGSYTRRILVSHAHSNPWFAPGPERAAHLKLNSFVTLPIPVGTMLNVRVRPVINGVQGAFGPASRLRVGGPMEGCETTTLIDDPMHAHYSCGVVRTFGGSDKIYAWPVAGATNYRFRFADVNSSFVRNIAGTQPVRLLNWFTLPLQAGATYDVSVAVSFDGGSTYCNFGGTCQVSIAAAAQQAAGRNVEADAPLDATLWPNPNTGDQLWLSIQKLPADVTSISLDIHDMRGQLVMDKVIPTQGGLFQDVVDLKGDLAKGMYLVTIIAGEQRSTERLVIQ